MIRRPPRSTQGVSSAASDVYKRQAQYQSDELFTSEILQSDIDYQQRKLRHGKGLERGKRISDIRRIQKRNLKLSQLIMG